MDRRGFIKYIGLAALASQISIPSFSEVQEKIKNDNQLFDEGEDAFWHIRKLMEERALPDWEYYFKTTGIPTFAEGEKAKKYTKTYHVFLLQNRCHFAECFTCHNEIIFDEKHQRIIFDRLIYNVDLFNSLPEEKQFEIVSRFEKLKLYHE